MMDEIEFVEAGTTDGYTFEELLSEFHKIASMSFGIEDLEKAKDWENKEREKLKDRLIQEKERFQNIYLTEKGSTYFVLKDGKSFRVSLKNGEWRNEYVCDYVFFVTSETAERLKKDNNEASPWVSMNGETFMNREIEVFDLKEGLIPFEFGVSGWQKIEVELSGGKLVIKGDKYGSFSSGAHFGHKITEIIK